MYSLLLKVILVVSIMFCIYLLYILLQKRNSYFHLQWNKKTLESFVVTNSIGPINSEFAKMPLSEYIVKASFNSAYGSDGNISKENLKNVIENERARFLDFDVYESDGKAKVGFSKSYDNSTNSDLVDFSTLMETVAGSAFATSNGSDPLFIHIRLNTENQQILSDMAGYLKITFDGKLCDFDVTPKTRLEKLINRVVFIINVGPEYSSNYSTILCPLNAKECTNLKDIANMDLISVSEDKIITQQTDPPTRKLFGRKNRRRSGVKTIKSTMPDLNNYVDKNTDSFFRIVNDYGVQYAMHQFYLDDDGLAKYKKLFEDQQSAFVTMKSALSYIAQNGGPEA